MGMLDGFKSWNRVRRAIKRVEYENKPAAIQALLREYPEESGRIADRATAMTKIGSPWYGLLLAVGLAGSGAPQAIEPLRLLVGRKFPGWRRLKENELRTLGRYLMEQEQTVLLEAMRARLDDRQLGWILPDVTADGFLAAFAHAAGKGQVGTLVQRLADCVEDVALGRRAADGRELDNAAGAAKVLWEQDCFDEALQLWALIAVASPNHLRDPEILRPVAEVLPKWVPSRPGPLRLPDGMEMDMSALPRPAVPPRVVRAADLLADFSQADWAEPLRRTWLRLDDLVRRDAHDDQLERDPRRLLPAQSIAAALGTCAALERQTQVLVRDETGRKQQHENLGRLVEERNREVEKYRRLVGQHHAGKDVINAILTQKDKIAECDERIRVARELLRGELTPVALLLHTVADAQAYPVEVRQGAAWGLHCILIDGVLDEAARVRVGKTLHAVLRDEEYDESALRDRIAAALPEGDGRVGELLVATERYAATRDVEELAATFHRVVPEAPSLVGEIAEGVDASGRPRGRQEFAERLLRLLPDARLLEFVGALRRGLRWMVELIEGRTGGMGPLEKNLTWIADLVREQLPGVLAFLHRYPLRLMTLERHRQILGLYSRDKVQVQFWTRYTPPRWFRGANPDELGQVHRRYLQLDDRSAPNAMGLYYRLFEHPILVLPVLYHEFLHFGGPAGDPEQGIDNETEVLLREVLFARHLIARLAPDDDAAIPEYEEILAAAIERAELVGLGQQLFHDFEDDEFLAVINSQIERAYGERLDAAVAKVEVDSRIRHWNQKIDLENKTDDGKRFWFPEIEWPELDIPETRDLTERLRTVLDRALQQDHRLDLARRNAVLAEAVCRSHRDHWHTYRRRRGALSRFAWHFEQRRQDPRALLAIVHRFEHSGAGLDLGGLLNLLRSGSGIAISERRR